MGQRLRRERKTVKSPGFHSMETFLRDFPFNGNFSPLFSIQWKIFERVFHSMENVCFRLEAIIVFPVFRATAYSVDSRYCRGENHGNDCR